MEQKRTPIAVGSADEDSETSIRKGPRWRVMTAAIAALIPALALLAGARDAAGSGQGIRIDDILINPSGVTTCSAAGTDDTAYSLSGFKLPATATYKINTSTFPSGLTSSEVTSAITSAFSAWDAATSKALFTNGGTTTNKPGTKDGVNSVGFGSLPSGTVGQAVAWTDSKTKTITEFDVTLSTGYSWATNTTASGDCGGAASKFDVRDVASHEAGHTTGLNDVTNSADHAQTMFGYAAYQELYKRDLAAGDKKATTTVYGQ